MSLTKPLRAAGLVAAIAAFWSTPSDSATDLARYQGIYCSERSGMMFQLSRVRLPRDLGQQTGVIPAEGPLSQEQLGLSRYFPARQERTPPVILTRSTEPIPYAGVVDIFRSADGAFELGAYDGGGFYLNAEQDDPPRVGSVRVRNRPPVSPEDALRLSMLGYVPALLPYAVPENYRTSTLYDEWQPCFEDRVAGKVTRARKQDIYWSYEPHSPVLSATASVYPLNNNETGGDDAYAVFVNDEGATTRSRVYNVSRPGDQSYSTADNQSWASFEVGCKYVSYCAVEIWDQDSGLRGADDRIGRVVLTKSQRGTTSYLLDEGSPAEYVLRVRVKAEGVNPIFAVREDAYLGDMTVYNFDTEHRSLLFGLATYTTITDTDVRNAAVHTDVDTFQIPYLDKRTWTYAREREPGTYQTGGFVLVFRSRADRDAVADRIERIETGKLWASLSLQLVAAATSLGGPTAQVGSALLKIVDDQVTNALTALVEDTVDDAGTVVTTPAANPFLMVTAPDYPNLTGEFATAVRALEDMDQAFNMPPALYCEMVKHPIDYLCPDPR